MSRPLRIQYPGAWYHVMNRGASYRNIFLSDKQRVTFLSLLEEITINYDIEIHAYCLMGNHYHLLVHTPRGNLSEAMRHLNSKYTRFFNKNRKLDGPLFRGRYKSIIISGEDYLLAISRYIHLNPLQAKRVSDLKKYIWSSYLAYVDMTSPPNWLKTRTILRRFKKKRKHPLTYEQFIQLNNDEKIRKFYDAPIIGPVLGDEDYCEKIFAQLKEKSMSSEISDTNRILRPPSINTILKTTARYFSVRKNTLLETKRRILNIPRAVAMVICREVGFYSLNEIAEAFNHVTYSTVSITIHRAKKVYDLNKDIKAVKKLLVSGNNKYEVKT